MATTAYVIDAPESSITRAEFVYNYYVADESIKDFSDVDISAQRTSLDSVSSRWVTWATRKVPRYVTLQITAPTTIQSFDTQNLILSQHLDKVVNEDAFASSQYVSINVPGNAIMSNITTIVSSSMTANFSKSGVTPRSPLEATGMLNSQTPSDVDVTALSDVVRNVFEGRADLPSRDVRSSIQVNSKYSTQVIGTAISDPNSLVAFEMSYVAPVVANNTKAQQPGSKASKSRSLLGGNDTSTREPIIKFVEYNEIPTVSTKTAPVSVVGYIIDKQEIRRDGSSVMRDPIVINNPRPTSVIDVAVKYGMTYAYSVRTIVLCHVPVTDIDTGNKLVAKVLVSAQPSAATTVECVEKVAPPPPADFDCVWDYDEDAPMLVWSFPTNPQRDIKMFQVFRRTSLALPFELIKQYDFSDNGAVSSYAESPLHVTRVESPVSFFVDKSFDKQSGYIYAVAAVDAHGYVSPYSMQHYVKFNKRKNVMSKAFVSHAGAPRQHPNLYVGHTIFVNSIRSIGRSIAKVYFNPEHFAMIDARGNMIPLVDDDVRCMLHFIDLQRMSSAIVNVSVDGNIWDIIETRKEDTEFGKTISTTSRDAATSKGSLTTSANSSLGGSKMNNTSKR